MQTPRLIKSLKPMAGLPTNGGGFYFVATVLDVEIDLPIEITSSIHFDRADSSQIEVIRQSLQKVEGNDSNFRRMNYECDWIPNDDTDPTKGYAAVPIPEHRWRYYILSFSGYGHEVNELLKVMFILEPCISAFAHFGTTLPFGCGEVFARGLQPSASQSFYFGLTTSQPSRLTMERVKNIQELLGLYKDLDATKHEGIMRAIEFFYTTNNFSTTGRMLVLAYFSVIEMLLTHNPNDKEIGDSISHQLITKISLLSGRLTSQFAYDIFEKGMTHDKVWSLLYSYRSAIAHGNHIDFVKKLKNLNSEQSSLKFIASATRILLRHALKEPDLINGLKPI